MIGPTIDLIAARRELDEAREEEEALPTPTLRKETKGQKKTSVFLMPIEVLLEDVN